MLGNEEQEAPIEYCMLGKVRRRRAGEGGMDVGSLEIDEAELSIRSSSLSSVKALFISLLSGTSGEGGFGGFPWTLFGRR